MSGEGLRSLVQPSRSIGKLSCQSCRIAHPRRPIFGGAGQGRGFDDSPSQRIPIDVVSDFQRAAIVGHVIKKLLTRGGGNVAWTTERRKSPARCKGQTCQCVRAAGCEQTLAISSRLPASFVAKRPEQVKPTTHSEPPSTQRHQQAGCQDLPTGRVHRYKTNRYWMTVTNQARFFWVHYQVDRLGWSS